MTKTNWGGKRPGAGRKPSGRKTKNFYITEEEYEALKKYLEILRNNETNKTLGD